MQPNQPTIPPQELPQPEEKLLRAPTFFEKNTWLKPVSIIVILIITIILSAYLLKANNASPWKSYVSNAGKYSLKYPPSYTLEENTSTNTTQISSNTIPGINTNFVLTISYKPADNRTLQELIEENKICPDISFEKGIVSSINGTKDAQLYLDRPCGSYTKTVAYTINNETLYIISVRTKNKFSEVKQYTDQIISTLKFTDQSPSQTVACTEEVIRCADGSWVGRTGPNCEIVCPSKDKPKPTSNIVCPADSKQCSDRTWVPRTGPKCEFICPDNLNTIDEEKRIKAWTSKEGLNIFGDPKDTAYAGGTPLFDESTGQTTSYLEYMLQKFPDKPWNK